MGATACASEQAAPLTAAAKHLGSAGEQQHLCWAGLVLQGISGGFGVWDTCCPTRTGALLLGTTNCLSGVGKQQLMGLAGLQMSGFGQQGACLLDCASSCQVMQDALSGSHTHGPGQRW